MGLTVSVVKRTVFGDQKVTIADITFDSSYPTGGEALNLQQLGLNTVNFMQIPSVSGYILEWDGTNKKIKVRTPLGAHTHTENTAASYAQNATTAASTAAAAAEVANATNLATLVIRVMAFGN